MPPNIHKDTGKISDLKNLILLENPQPKIGGHLVKFCGTIFKQTKILIIKKLKLLMKSIIALLLILTFVFSTQAMKMRTREPSRLQTQLKDFDRLQTQFCKIFPDADNC